MTEPNPNQSPGNADQGGKSRRWIKPVVILAVLGALGSLYWMNRDQLSLEMLTKQQDAILAYQAVHPILVLVAAYFLYTAVTGMSLPGAAVMTLMYGWFFRQVYGEVWGVVVGVVLISFASTSGATIAFLITRFVLGESIQKKFAKQLARFNEALEREGAFYLFSLRLIPAVPFFVINLVMGLTPIRVRTFWWVSQLGMLPGTIVFVLAGTRIPGPKKILEDGASGILDWQLFAAFILLGVFPLLVKKIMGTLRRQRPMDVD